MKTWAMRGTLRLLAARDLPLVSAAHSVYANRYWPGNFACFGIDAAQYAAFLAAVPRVLSEMPMTREQLAAAVAKELRLPALGELLLAKGWGSPLKPSAWRASTRATPTKSNCSKTRVSAGTGTGY